MHENSKKRRQAKKRKAKRREGKRVGVVCLVARCLSLRRRKEERGNKAAQQHKGVADDDVNHTHTHTHTHTHLLAMHGKESEKVSWWVVHTQPNTKQHQHQQQQALCCFFLLAFVAVALFSRGTENRWVSSANNERGRIEARHKKAAKTRHVTQR